MPLYLSKFSYTPDTWARNNLLLEALDRQHEWSYENRQCPRINPTRGFLEQAMAVPPLARGNLENGRPPRRSAVGAQDYSRRG